MHTIVGLAPMATTSRYGGCGVCVLEPEGGGILAAVTVRITGGGVWDLPRTYTEIVRAVAAALDMLERREPYVAVALPNDAHSMFLAGMLVANYRAELVEHEHRMTMGRRLDAWPDALVGRREGVSRALSAGGPRDRDRDAYIAALVLDERLRTVEVTASDTGS